MTCKEVIERLSEYWSNELDKRTRDELTAHLRGCPSCQHEWAMFQAAMNALRSVSTPEPSPELLSRIQSAVMAKVTARQHRKPVLVWRWQWAMATGAAAIVIALVSMPIFNRVGERARVSSPYPILAERPAPLLPSPALKQPLPSPSAMPPLLKPQPSPAEQIAKPRRLATIERREARTTGAERRQEYPKSGKLLPSGPIAELPGLEVPKGERIPEQSEKGIPAEIVPPAEQTAPKLAELPVEPRIVPFKLEAKLSERTQVSETRETERMPTSRGPIGPIGQQGPAGPHGPIVTAPALGGPKKVEAETQAPALMGQHFPMTAQQYGGGLRQALFAVPFALRWSKFEPVVVGKVTLWQLAIGSDNPQIVTVYLRPGEKVEILNAQQPVIGEGKGLVIWRDKVHLGKEILVPVLIRANEVGTRKLLVTLETTDGKTFSWWCIFPAMSHEEQPKIRRPLTLQIEQWTVLDLFAHFAWENKVAFLLPEQIGYRTINVPTKTTSLWEILALLERQIGVRWQRFGSTFSLTIPLFTPVAPTTKQ